MTLESESKKSDNYYTLWQPAPLIQPINALESAVTAPNELTQTLPMYGGPGDDHIVGDGNDNEMNSVTCI